MKRTALALLTALALTGCTEEGQDWTLMRMQFENICESEIPNDQEPEEVFEGERTIRYWQTSAGREFVILYENGAEDYTCHGDTKTFMGEEATYDAQVGEWR